VLNQAARYEDVLGGSEGTDSSLHAFLIVALDGGEWSALRTGRFSPTETAPGTHWVGSWVGPSADVDAVAKRKIPSPCRESNPGRPAQ
jgi:hypothetical protein